MSSTTHSPPSTFSKPAPPGQNVARAECLNCDGPIPHSGISQQVFRPKGKSTWFCWRRAICAHCNIEHCTLFQLDGSGTWTPVKTVQRKPGAALRNRRSNRAA